MTSDNVARPLTIRSTKAESKPVLRVRRSRHCSLSIDDEPGVDLLALLSGQWRLAQKAYIRGYSPLSNRTIDLQPAEIEVLSRIPSNEFVELEALDTTTHATVRKLLAAGLLVSDRDTLPDAKHREIDEKLSSVGWHPSALNFHFGSRWGDDDPARAEATLQAAGDETADRQLDRYIRLHGDPPPHFFSVESNTRVELPLETGHDSWLEKLRERKSIRQFDVDDQMRLSILSKILYYVFGCAGCKRITSALTVLKKNSPSAGALHPTEAFLLVNNVEDLAPGFYHYNVADHRLDCIRAMSVAEGRAAAVDIAADQEYFGTAPVLVMLVSRFDRLFWKYRSHKKAYKVSLMDAAHLSQTFYLVCTALGLGACFTGAIRDASVERYLALDPTRHGAAGICACGTPAPGGDDMVLETVPYVPRSNGV